MLKKVLRKTIKITNEWLDDDRDGKEPITSLPDNANHQWLNKTLFPGLLAEGGRAFRPQYTWGVMQSVHTAKALGISRVSVIEFGVAGGNGLVSLEKIAQKIGTLYGIEIDTYGFDTGQGLPKPVDYRDLPNLYHAESFRMDPECLKEHLQKATLILGLIEDTIMDFIRSKPAPVAFISIDVDLYSSTTHALQLLDAEQELLLPRIYCYFDDIIGRTCCEFNGERLAIADFNATHEMRKIGSIYGLRYFLPGKYANAMWTEKFFMAHIFDHKLYANSDSLAQVPSLSLDATF